MWSRTRARRWLSLLLPLAFLAPKCDNSESPTGPEAPLNQAFELKLGETATLSGEGLRLTLEAVPEDSRCPIDVTCVWEGDAIARVRIARGEAAPLVELHTNPGFAQEAEAFGLLVRLVDLQPHPREGVTILPRDYVAKLLVTRS